MANEIRVRANLISGTLSVALSNVDTTMSAAALASLPVIDTTNYAAVTIENEIVWVTAHTAAATTATILRAQEGTVAAAHSINMAWQHGPTAFDGGIDWTPYTPTLTQGATVTKTVAYAKYMRIGRVVFFQVDLNVTGTGTAATAVTVGLPIASPTQTGAPLYGQGLIYDSSAGTVYNGNIGYASTTTITIWPSADGGPSMLGVRAFTAALASGDVVRASGFYEALT